MKPARPTAFEDRTFVLVAGKGQGYQMAEMIDSKPDDKGMVKIRRWNASRPGCVVGAFDEWATKIMPSMIVGSPPATDKRMTEAATAIRRAVDEWERDHPIAITDAERAWQDKQLTAEC